MADECELRSTSMSAVGFKGSFILPLCTKIDPFISNVTVTAHVSFMLAQIDPQGGTRGESEVSDNSKQGNSGGSRNNVPSNGGSIEAIKYS